MGLANQSKIGKLDKIPLVSQGEARLLWPWETWARISTLVFQMENIVTLFMIVSKRSASVGEEDISRLLKKMIQLLLFVLVASNNYVFHHKCSFENRLYLKEMKHS